MDTPDARDTLDALLATLAEPLDRLAAKKDFSGVVSVARAGKIVFAQTYGFAHRGHRVPNTVGTRFAIASGTKGLTALTVVSLVQEGRLHLMTTAREILRTDLPLIDRDVTVEHLLAHRSGIGDYYDEESDHPITEYPLSVPVQALTGVEAYLPTLEGIPAKGGPGWSFTYNNSGYVVLSILAERVSGVPFADLVRQRVCEPAGMPDTAFLRSDELPADTALGYFHPASEGSDRTNVFHLPVIGAGDGGMYSTAADFAAFWPALYEGRIVWPEWASRMVRPRSDAGKSKQYGLGFWLETKRFGTFLEGYDAGVSFRSVYVPHADVSYTVMSNTTEGAWPVARFLGKRLADPPRT
jgi:CubicO group peptidase (beta-lactamase class C family)